MHRNLFTICFSNSELSVGMTTEGVEVSSVGNTLTLHETALVEAFNLKAALEYINKNCKCLNLLFVNPLHPTTHVSQNP